MKRKTKWHVDGDLGRRAYLTRTRRRATLTVTAPDTLFVGFSALAVNLTPAALRKLARRSDALAELLDRGAR